MSYPSPPPPSGSQGKLRGSSLRLFGWISLGLSIVLFITGGALLASGENDKVGDFQRVKISAGSGTFDADRTGQWIGYYEASNVTDDIDRIPKIQLQITDPSGKNVDFDGYGNRSDGNVDKKTYDTDGHKGAAAIQFTVNEKGKYTVRTRAVDTLPSDAEIAFGDDVGGVGVGAILALVGVVLFLLAIVLLIVGFVKRSRDKKERQQAASSGYGQPPYGGGPQQGWGQRSGQPQSGQQQPGQQPNWGPQAGWGPGGGPPPTYGPPQ